VMVVVTTKITTLMTLAGFESLKFMLNKISIF
jgi:hypothetical protein